jgi:steroid 5-alpha reductase family enzyme
VPSPRCKINQKKKRSGGEDMESIFQGLVLFLIGLSDIFAVHTIREAEISGILGLLGLILMVVGIVWGALGEKIEVSVSWK